MKAVKFFALALSVLSLAAPAISNAALPTCLSASSDIDGDGFGWEQNASCRVASGSTGSTGTSKPECQDPSSDPDGDGFGWENNASCVVTGNTNTNANTNANTNTNTGSSSNSSKPVCSSASLDPDGDGFGWENNASCVVDSTSVPLPATGDRSVCSSAASDPDGDGFGWENNATCVVGETVDPPSSGIRSTSSVYPYKANARYAGKLKGCALIETSSESCTLNDLPFIGQVHSNPTVDDIMGRVLVTHDWMGKRFERVLNESPALLLPMFRSIAVIMIGSEVRPAYYSRWNGLMAIDPGYLWMSLSEKRTIDPGDDYRSEFGADLKFDSYRSFRKSDGSALPFFSLTDNSERQFSDLIERVVSLLFHELSHAADFAPVWTLADMNRQDSLYNAIIANYPNWLSPRLQAVYPNQSEDLSSLAGVRFFNDVPTENEKSYTAELVGSVFANDGAISFYSYSTIREDFANLVQAAMMKYSYDISTNIYFYDKATATDPSCRIGWGVKNRLANPSVLPRAEWAVNRAVVTGSAIDTFFASGTGVEVSNGVGFDLCSAAKKGPGFDERLDEHAIY